MSSRLQMPPGRKPVAASALGARTAAPVDAPAIELQVMGGQDRLEKSAENIEPFAFMEAPQDIQRRVVELSDSKTLNNLRLAHPYLAKALVYPQITTLRIANINDLERGLLRLPHVEELDLSGSGRIVPAHLAQLAKLPKLRKLQLTGCDLLELDGNAFAAFPNLRELDLGHSSDWIFPPTKEDTASRFVAGSVLESLPASLTKLNLRGRVFVPVSFRRLSQLRSLDLSGCINEEPDLVTLHGLPDGLQSLALSYCYIITPDAVRKIPRGIKKLDFQGLIGTFHPDILSAMPEQLEELDLSHLIAAGEASLDTLPQHLKRLNLVCRDIREWHLQSLPASLEWLKIGRSPYLSQRQIRRFEAARPELAFERFGLEQYKDDGED